MTNEEVTDKKLSVYQVGTMPEIVTKDNLSLHGIAISIFSSLKLD